MICDAGECKCRPGSIAGLDGCETVCPIGATQVNGRCQCRVNFTLVDNVCVPECPPGTQRVNGQCVPICLRGASLVNGKCQCNAGLEDFGGSCVPVCPAGSRRGPLGDCVSICPPGTKRNDAGECQSVCPANQEFKNGKCQCKDGDIMFRGRCFPDPGCAADEEVQVGNPNDQRLCFDGSVEEVGGDVRPGAGRPSAYCQCKGGKRKDTVEGKCVSQFECACYKNGHKIPTGMDFYGDSGCNEFYVCSRSYNEPAKMTKTQATGCPAGETCQENPEFATLFYCNEEAGATDGGEEEYGGWWKNYF